MWGVRISGMDEVGEVGVGVRMVLRQVGDADQVILISIIRRTTRMARLPLRGVIGGNMLIDDGLAVQTEISRNSRDRLVLSLQAPQQMMNGGTTAMWAVLLQITINTTTSVPPLLQLLEVEVWLPRPQLDMDMAILDHILSTTLHLLETKKDINIADIGARSRLLPVQLQAESQTTISQEQTM